MRPRRAGPSRWCDDPRVAQKEIQLILVRQLATHLALPIFVVDENGDLLFFNEAAEALLGRPFDEEETGLEPRIEALSPRDQAGRPIPPAEMPGMVAMQRGHPVHSRFQMATSGGTHRMVEASAFPLTAAGGRLLGAVVVFWPESGEADHHDG